MIDGAEGVGVPDGKDPRYPLRSGTAPGWEGDTDWVLSYMSNHGVTSSNLAFYLGTHAHSDHIDNADDIIRKFRPKVIGGRAMGSGRVWRVDRAERQRLQHSHRAG